jgi:hypothetical protein
MGITQLKNKLINCEPYLIERDLLPKLYFKEEECDKFLDCYGNKREVEYWIFKYIFIRGVTEDYIAVRLDYSQQTISYRLRKIIERNKTLIEEFLVNY